MYICKFNKFYVLFLLVSDLVRTENKSSTGQRVVDIAIICKPSDMYVCRPMLTPTSHSTLLVKVKIKMSNQTGVVRELEQLLLFLKTVHIKVRNVRWVFLYCEIWFNFLRLQCCRDEKWEGLHRRVYFLFSKQDI